MLLVITKLTTSLDISKIFLNSESDVFCSLLINTKADNMLEKNIFITNIIFKKLLFWVLNKTSV
ncbi:MAG: hypothetical protein ACRAVC_22125, partial [Trichormus sp.]